MIISTYSIKTLSLFNNSITNLFNIVDSNKN